MPTLLSGSDNSVKLRVESEADNTGFDESAKGLKNLGEQGKDTEGKLTSFAESFQGGMKKVAAVTAVAGAGLTLYAKSSLDKFGDLVRSSKTLATQTGMTAVESSRLVAALGRMGIDSDNAALSFRNLSKIIADSRDNSAQNALKQEEMANKIKAAKIEIQELNKEISTNGDSTGSLKVKLEALNIQLRGYEQNLAGSTNTLDKLGISTVDAEGKAKDFYDILLDVSDKFKEMPDGAEKTALALDLFGRNGAGMIKALSGGREQIIKLGEEADKLGLTLTGENIESFNAYIKAQKELADSTNGISIAVGALTAPLMTEFNTKLNDVITTLIGADAPLRDVVVGVLAFGGPILGATAGVAEFAANIAGAIPLMKGLAGLIASPMIMPAIAVAAALGALGLVIAKANETHDAIQEAGNAIENNRKLSDETDAAIKKAHDEGRISTEALQTYLRNTERAAEQTKSNLYTGFFGPMQQSLDWLAIEISGRGEQFKGSGFGGRASGGPVSAGTPYWVGENPDGSLNSTSELFIPGQSGTIVNSKDVQSAISSMGGGGGRATGGTVMHIQQVILSTAESVDRFVQYGDLDAQRTSIGLSPSRSSW